MKNPRVLHLGEADARRLASELADSPMAVTDLRKRPYKRSPSAPYRTSTLQQDASRRLRMAPARAMRAAQQLYEKGHITYMRTDSISISAEAVATARGLIRERFGDRYLPARPRAYRTKVKAAQEAHEAIRPAGAEWKSPQEVTAALGEGDASRLYRLIWAQTLASQMKDAVGETVSVTVGGQSSAGQEVEFRAQGRTITFRGFLKVHGAASTPAGEQRESGEKILPPLTTGQALRTVELTPKDHQTRPPAWYTEASLIRTLEKLGVGRPSTYASIMSTIADRGYVWRQGRALIPTFTAFAVVTLLEGSFPRLVDYQFTAKMEDDLDRIADRREQTRPWLERFYFGDDGLQSLVASSLENVDTSLSRKIPIGSDPEGEEIAARIGRYGPYLQWKGKTADIPDRLAPDELTVEKALEMLAQGSASQDRKILGNDPNTGLEVLALDGRYGPLPATRGDPAREGQTQTGLAAQGDGTGGSESRQCAAMAEPAPRSGSRPRQRRESLRPVRALWTLRLPRQDQPQSPRSRATVQHHARRGPADTGHPARPARGRGAADAGRGSPDREESGAPGRPVRTLRERRDDQRLSGPGRHRGQHHSGASQRPAGDAPPEAGRAQGPAALPPPQVSGAVKTPAAAAGVTNLLSALVWAAALAADPGPWNPFQSLVLGAGSVVLACAALVGMVVRGARWGRRLAGGLAVGELGIATIAPISPWWWAGVGIAGATLILVGGPWPAEAERRRAAQLGPPPRAVLLLCLLAGLPVALAGIAVNGLGGAWVLTGLSAAAAPAYAKAWPGALPAARFLIPAASLAAAFTTPWPGWAAAVAGGGAVAWAAWSEDARLAVQPLVETGPPPAPGPTPLRIRSATATAAPRRAGGERGRGSE